ncbi:MAG: hypothetical protein Q7S88_00890 [Candidatus Daviesbacteria bacterium]|nr:hypothetical protein [Candidatus Daviesbacteria bacterium]
MGETLRRGADLWISTTDKNNQITVRASMPIDLGRRITRRGNGQLAFPQMFRISFLPSLSLNDVKLQRLQDELQKYAEVNEYPRPEIVRKEDLLIDCPGLRFNEVEGMIEFLSSYLNL